jgi:hypothetical protein
VISRQGEELKLINLENCKLLKSSEVEIEAIRAEGLDMEVKLRKVAQQQERSETEMNNRVIETEEEIQRVGQIANLVQKTSQGSRTEAR